MGRVTSRLSTVVVYMEDEVPKHRSIAPAYLVITFDDGRRTRLDISQWLDRQDGLISTFMQGRFIACGVEWPLGELLPGAVIRKMLDEQKSVIS
jgi:hypothetical protein